MNRRVLTLLLLAAVSAGVFLFQGEAGPLWKAAQVRDGARLAAQNNEEGLRRLEAGDLDGAIERFRTAVSEDRYNEVLRRNLSLSLSRKAAAQSEEGPEDLLDEALDLWPENPEALDLMSAIHFSAGRYREAWDLAARLAAFYPEHPGLGGYLSRLEQYLREEDGMVKESGHFFRLQYGGGRKLEFEGELMAIFQDEMDELAAYMGVFPKDPIDILLLTEELGEVAVPMDPALSGLYDGRIRLYLGKELPPLDELVRTARHELVHALLHRAGRVPVWFQEGLAQILGGEIPVSELRNLEGALRQGMQRGWRLEMDSLGETFLTLPERERAMAYSASLLYVNFLLDRYGRNLVPIVVAELERGGHFFDILRSVTGRDPQALQDDFVLYLKRGA